MTIFYHTIHSLWMVFWFPTDKSVGNPKYSVRESLRWIPFDS